MENGKKNLSNGTHTFRSHKKNTQEGGGIDEINTQTQRTGIDDEEEEEEEANDNRWSCEVHCIIRRTGLARSRKNKDVQDDDGMVIIRMVGTYEQAGLQVIAGVSSIDILVNERG